MVWPVDDYTNKIHSALRCMFSLYPHLSFTKSQMAAHLVKGFGWLANPNERQSILLDKIIHTGITKLVQHNMVVLVKGATTIEKTWQHRKGMEVSGYTNITSEDAVLTNALAAKSIKNRAVGAKKLWELNHPQAA